MYQYSYSSNSSSRRLCSSFRSDIVSLLGNCGKTIYSNDFAPSTFRFGFSLSESIRDLYIGIVGSHRVKAIVYLFAILLGFSVLPIEGSFASSGEQRTFIATAYYSPLPNQKNYYRGSYEADIRLNGGGTHGARGTPVFTGMVAAPSTYAFGTKIYFEGLGLGVVEDRGGAIVEAGERGQEYDRIDIWMGYGDAGLRRTLAWGRREVQGTLVSSTSELPMIDVLGIENGRVDLSGFSSASSAGAGGLTSSVVSKFADLGYSAKDGDIKGMIIQFQIDQGIIRTSEDDGAGNYGPKTRSALAKAYTTYTSLRQKELDAINEARKLLISDHDAWQKKYSEAERQVVAFGNPRIKDMGDNVRALQEFLTRTGSIVKIDGKMSIQTLGAIKKYQHSRGLTPTGVLDLSTQNAMIDDITSGN